MPWPSEVPQRALEDLFEQAMTFEGSSKVPHRTLRDLFKHVMVSKVTSNGGRDLLLLGLQDLHLGVDRLDRVLSLLHLAVHPLD